MFVESVRGDSLLRARLSMPVWPFSDDYDCFGGEAATEDGGGYWGVDPGVGAAVAAAGYLLWRIPAAESAWQGGNVCVCLISCLSCWLLGGSR